MSAAATDPHGADDQGLNDPYFTDDERAELIRWRAVCAGLPPPTPEQVEAVATVIRRIEQERDRSTPVTPRLPQVPPRATRHAA